MNEKLKIYQMFVDKRGWFSANSGEIKEIYKNGEMAKIKWYQQKDEKGITHEWNSRYVIEIQYKE